MDFVVDMGSHLAPIEVKLSATPHLGMAAGIRTFQKLHGGKAAPGYVIHPGVVRLPLAPGVTALPFGAL